MPIVEKKKYRTKAEGWFAGTLVGKGKKVLLSADEAQYLLTSGAIEPFEEKEGEPVEAESEPLPVDPPIVGKTEASERTASAVAATTANGPRKA